MNGEGRLFRWIDQFSELVVLGILWVICSLPIVTAGPSSAALYQAIRKTKCEEAGTPFRIFFQTWCQCLRKGWILTAFYEILLATVVFCWGTNWITSLSAEIAVVILLSSWVYCFPIMARFELTILQYFQTAIFFSIHYLKNTLLLLLTLALCVVLCGIFPFLLPAVVGAYGLYSIQLLEPLFASYEHE